MNKHQQNEFDAEIGEDFTVLNFLLRTVKGLSPSSLTPELAFEDDTEIE